MKIPTFNPNPQPKPRHDYRGWLIWIAIFIGVRIMLKHPSDDQLMLLFAGYMLPLWLYIIIANTIVQVRFNHYLKTNHPDRWRQVSPIGDLGGRGHFFYFSKEDWGDPVIRAWKHLLFRLWRFILVVLLTSPIIFVALMIIR